MNLVQLKDAVLAIAAIQKLLLKAVVKLGILCGRVLIFTRSTPLRSAPTQTQIDTALPAFSGEYDAIRTEIEALTDQLGTDAFSAPPKP